jgi:hypothetical protein
MQSLVVLPVFVMCHVKVMQSIICSILNLAMFSSGGMVSLKYSRSD